MTETIVNLDNSAAIASAGRQHKDLLRHEHSTRQEHLIVIPIVHRTARGVRLPTGARLHALRAEFYALDPAAQRLALPASGWDEITSFYRKLLQVTQTA